MNACLIRNEQPWTEKWLFVSLLGASFFGLLCIIGVFISVMEAKLPNGVQIAMYVFFGIMFILVMTAAGITVTGILKRWVWKN